MAFVWSRLALAAVLAAGAATPALAAPVARGRCDDAPSLACAVEVPTIVVDLGSDSDSDRAGDPPVVAVEAPRLGGVAPAAIDVLPAAPDTGAGPVRDILTLAPKTSPPT